MNDIWNTINEKAASKQPFLFVIDFECTRAIVEDLPINAQDILVDFPHYRNVTYPKFHLPFTFSKKAITFGDYQWQFTQVMEHLTRGDSFLLNLTARTPIETSLGLKMLFF